MDATPTEARMACRELRLVANEPIAGGCHRLAFELPDDMPAPRAGQFAMLSTDDPLFPLLPRPFSVLGADRERGLLEFMIMPVGTGSGLLCNARVDDRVRVVGPLGHALDDGLPEGPVVCVAGGYGVAPFLFLLEAWVRAGQLQRVAESTLIYGARTAERLSLLERLEATGARLELCTDDGSRGFHGRVDACLTGRLGEEPVSMVLTCGPEPMMEAVGHVAAAAEVPARASLETVMGCGYAVCNGCAVAVDGESLENDGYTFQLACREGTLFDESCLHWERL